MSSLPLFSMNVDSHENHACMHMVSCYCFPAGVVLSRLTVDKHSYIGQEVGLKLPLMIRRSQLPTHLMYYAVFFISFGYAFQLPKIVTAQII